MEGWREGVGDKQEQADGRSNWRVKGRVKGEFGMWRSEEKRDRGGEEVDKKDNMVIDICSQVCYFHITVYN